MISTLEWIEKEKLPEWLRSTAENSDSWNSLLVDYEKPHVWRLWREVITPENERVRVNLHVIWPCQLEEALLHPHPWPSAMHLLRGAYVQQMVICPTSHSLEEEKVPPSREDLDNSTHIQSEGSMYHMTDRDGWHRIAPFPDQPVFSVMVTGRPWQRWTPPVTKLLSPLPPHQKIWQLEQFRSFFLPGSQDKKEK